MSVATSPSIKVFSPKLGREVEVTLSPEDSVVDEVQATGAGTRMLVPDWDPLPGPKDPPQKTATAQESLTSQAQLHITMRASVITPPSS